TPGKRARANYMRDPGDLQAWNRGRNRCSFLCAGAPADRYNARHAATRTCTCTGSGAWLRWDERRTRAAAGRRGGAGQAQEAAAAPTRAGAGARAGREEGTGGGAGAGGNPKKGQEAGKETKEEEGRAAGRDPAHAARTVAPGVHAPACPPASGCTRACAAGA